jgi:nucleoside-diphosphate-sugar epimerase
MSAVRRVLVTGHDGFVGTYLKTLLESTGACVAGLLDPRGASVDVRDYAAVERAVRHFAPDTVYHLAGVSGPMLDTDNLPRVVEVNCVGTANVVDVSCKAGVRRVIYAGSVSGYATGTAVSAMPDSVYAATKRFGEDLVDQYRGRFDIDLCSVRIGSVYGPGRKTSSPVHDMLHEAQKTGTVSYRPGAVEPLIWVEDCARMLAGLAQLSGPTRPRYDAVAETLSHRSIAETVAALVPADLITGPRDETAFYPMPFDSSSLRIDSNIPDLVDLRRGLLDLLGELATSGIDAGRRRHV